MKRFLIAVGLAGILAGCVTTPPTEAQCGPQPTAAQVDEAVKQYVASANWKDPASVQIRNVRLTECLSMYNGLLAGGGHTFGWDITLEVNAKNSYGGYAGFERRTIIRTPDGQIVFDP